MHFCPPEGDNTLNHDLWTRGLVGWVLVTLMTGTLGLNLDDSWFRTSARSC